MHRTAGLVALLAALTVVLPLLANDKPILAVMEIEDKTGKFTDTQIQEAATYLRSKLEVAGTFLVVAKSRQEKALIRELRKESFKDCYAEQCQIELGKELAADTILKSRVTKFAGTCTLTSAVISLGSAASVGGASADFDCSEKGLKGALDRVLRKVLGRDDGTGGQVFEGNTGEVAEGLEQGTLIALSVEPGDAEWEIDKGHGGAGVLDGDKRVTVIRLAPGKHILELSRDGYVSTTVELYLEEGDLRTVQETLSPRVERGGGSGVGWLDVKSEPEDGAQVFLDGNDTGKRTPVTLEDIPEGAHAVLLRQRFYKDKVIRVQVPSDAIEKAHVSMEPNFGSVRIDSNPADADVYIDGVRDGKTPYVKNRMESKAYKLKLSYNLYHDQQAMLYVGPGDNVEKMFELPPAFGTLEVRASGDGKELAGAKVTLDMEPKGTTPAKLERLRSGPYQVKISYPMYRDYSEEVEVKDGQTTHVDAKLDTNFGVISVTAKPSDSAIFVDGQSRGKGETLVKVPAGKHTVQVRHRDPTYRQFERTLAVAVGEKIELRPTLERRVGDVMVSSDPPGGLLKVDGRVVGESPQKVSGLTIGKHSLRVERKGFTPQQREIEIAEGKVLKVRLDLSAKPVLKIRCAPPEGEIRVDDKQAGIGVAEVQVAPGKHRVSCRAKGYVAQEKTLTATAGELDSVDIELTKRGTLRVTSDVPGTSLYLDGKLHGTAPVTLTDLPEGEVSLKCIAKFAVWDEKTVDIEDGAVTEWRCAPDPKRYQEMEEDLTAAKRSRTGIGRWNVKNSFGREFLAASLPINPALTYVITDDKGGVDPMLVLCAVPTGFALSFFATDAMEIRFDQFYTWIPMVIAGIPVTYYTFPVGLWDALIDDVRDARPWFLPVSLGYYALMFGHAFALRDPDGNGGPSDELRRGVAYAALAGWGAGITYVLLKHGLSSSYNGIQSWRERRLDSKIKKRKEELKRYRSGRFGFRMQPPIPLPLPGGGAALLLQGLW